MKLNFLRSDSAQSTLRIIVLMLSIAVVIDLLALIPLIYIALTLGRDLGWVATYLIGLAGLSSASIVGKVLQKKYEGDDTSKPAE